MAFHPIRGAKLASPAAARAAEMVDDLTFGSVQARFDAMQRAADREDAEATLRADRDFHLELLALAGNRKLVTVLEDLRNLVLTRGIATAPNARIVDDFLAASKRIRTGNRPRTRSSQSFLDRCVRTVKKFPCRSPRKTQTRPRRWRPA
ncbi:FCD domain-containing protein [Prescottella agglutinans]|uniref:FCD domain-containing protein n=1 Tax=Prescottella agglutinans TaxID=1644129 RepID=UPI003CC86C07